MLEAHTFIVRIYRRESGRGGRTAGFVEIVDQQRCVPFAGYAALRQILAKALLHRRKDAGTADGPAGDVDE